MHLDKSGTIPPSKPPSPKTIEAMSQARDRFIRTLCGAIILVALTVAYVVALFKELEAASNILVLLSSGLGFLVGTRTSKDSDS